MEIKWVNGKEHENIEKKCEYGRIKCQNNINKNWKKEMEIWKNVIEWLTIIKKKANQEMKKLGKIN